MVSWNQSTYSKQNTENWIFFYFGKKCPKLVRLVYQKHSYKYWRPKSSGNESYLYLYFSELISFCFENGECPTLIKIAKVTLVHKKYSNHLLYRPILTLYFCSQSYENWTRIYYYLVQNKPIYFKQFGFRSTCILLIIQW